METGEQVAQVVRILSKDWFTQQTGGGEEKTGVCDLRHVESKSL